MGEFLALITLDSDEVRGIIIPQAISLPLNMVNSYILAATLFLIAEHRYICTLQKPKISFKGGSTKTMNVIRGHHVINMTPIPRHQTQLTYYTFVNPTTHHLSSTMQHTFKTQTDPM